MEEAIKSCKKQGWNLSSEKIKEEFLQREESATEAERQFLRDPERWLLDQDIKSVGAPSLPEKINSGGTSQISTPVVLQVKNIEVVSAPKQNEESGASPRMLKITLTDGKTACHGIEYGPIPKISPKTPPGTKVRLVNTVRLLSGFLLLDSKNLQVLGGEVAELVEEWKIQQLLKGHVRAAVQDGGPPPWVPFGRKVQPIVEVKKDTQKSLEEKANLVKDEEFLNQRQEAIAAAAEAGPGVNKIIKGSGRQMEVHVPERRGRGRGRRERDFSSRDAERAARPPDSGGVRLFDFLQPQIGAEEAEEEALDVEEADQPSWERDGIYRPRGSSEPHDRGGRFDRGRRGGRSYDDDDRSRGQGGHRGRRGGPDRGRGRGRRGSYQEWGGSDYGRPSSDRTNDRSVNNLVEDFTAWPGLGDAPKEPSSKPAGPPPGTSFPRHDVVRGSEQWAVDDYCLAKWESTDHYYPAVIQQLIPNRKSVTVLFIESGSIRIVETKHLRRDPQDSSDGIPSQAAPSRPPPARGNQQHSGRIYTPRRGAGGPFGRF